MEVEQIEVVRKWPQLKLAWDIQIFLGFANFYWQFIKGFSKIATPLISILKTTRLSNVSGFKVGNSNDKVVIFSIGGGGAEFAKKSGKLKG